MWRIYNEILALECCLSCVCRRYDAHNSAGVSRITINKFSLLLFIPFPKAKFQSKRIFAQRWIIENMPCFLLHCLCILLVIVWMWMKVCFAYLQVKPWNFHKYWWVQHWKIEESKCGKLFPIWQFYETYRRAWSHKYFSILRAWTTNYSSLGFV